MHSVKENYDESQDEEVSAAITETCMKFLKIHFGSVSFPRMMLFCRWTETMRREVLCWFLVGDQNDSLE